MMELRQSKTAWTWSHKALRLLWMMAWSIVAWGPRWMSPLRVAMLRAFGAKIGRHTLFCGRVKVLMPWNLAIGDEVAVSEGVNFYNFASIEIGPRTCLSQSVWLCTGSHDHTRRDFPLIYFPIVVGADAWVAAEVFVHPKVRIGNGTVVGARSVVTRDLPAWSVCSGNPCVKRGERTVL